MALLLAAILAVASINKVFVCRPMILVMRINSPPKGGMVKPDKLCKLLKQFTQLNADERVSNRSFTNSNFDFGFKQQKINYLGP